MRHAAPIHVEQSAAVMSTKFNELTAAQKRLKVLCVDIMLGFRYIYLAFEEI